MKNIICLLIIAFLITTCNKDDNKSDEAQILEFSITNVSNPDVSLTKAIVDATTNTVIGGSSIFIDEDQFPVTITPEFTISEGASVIPASGEAITFAAKGAYQSFTVTAEDGTIKTWYITIRDNQLPNSDFQQWFTATGLNGAPYLEIGQSAETSIWATANLGTSTYSVYGTKPLVQGTDTLVRIVTDSTSIVPVAAGTIFTGKFDVAGAIGNPTDPQQATDFGTPFWFRPSAMKISYKYTAGADYVKATLNNPNSIFGGFTITNLAGEDSCTMFAILELREGDLITELGRAELFSASTNGSVQDISIPFVYTSSAMPTHISVVFSSSKDGDTYTGAVGSELVIDNLEFVY